MPLSLAKSTSRKRFVTPEHMHVMVSPFNELTVVDYGDIAMDQMSTERSVAHVRQIVREIAETGAIPMVVGGDHSCIPTLLPSSTSMAKVKSASSTSTRTSTSGSR